MLRRVNGRLLGWLAVVVALCGSVALVIAALHVGSPTAASLSGADQVSDSCSATPTATATATTNRYGHGNSHAYADADPHADPYGYGNRHGDRLANTKLLAHADGRCVDFQHVA